jgi:hypothetical protein
MSEEESNDDAGEQMPQQGGIKTMPFILGEVFFLQCCYPFCSCG